MLISVLIKCNAYRQISWKKEKHQENWSKNIAGMTYVTETEIENSKKYMLNVENNKVGT